MWHKSIRWQIQAWHGLLLALITVTLLVAFYQFERRERLRQLDDSLRQTLVLVLPGVMPMPGRGFGPPQPGPGVGENRPPPFPPPGPGPGGPGPGFREQQFVASLSEGPIYFVVWSPAGGIQQKSTNAPDAVPAPSRTGAETATTSRSRPGFREILHFHPSGTVVLLGTSTSAVDVSSRNLALTLSAVGIAVVAFGLVGGWWLAHRAIRPIAQISAAAEEIAAGDLSRRIDTDDTGNELGRLAGVLNHTFERLDEAFQQQVRFTADASHELRTPVSVILTQTQTALNRERNPEEYREALEACQRAAQRMRGLIHSLLELARIDSGEETLEKTPLDLAKVASDTAELIRPLAEEHGLDIRTELTTARCKGDAERLAQVATNLLMNAIQHTPTGGHVCVNVVQRNGSAILTVTDTGRGIAPQDLPHVFERFYRADKSRSRNKGNAGLGLAITRSIVEAHGGSIAVTSTQGEGATFTVRLPIG